jgi:hypothetical protein
MRSFPQQFVVAPVAVKAILASPREGAADQRKERDNGESAAMIQEPR